MMLSAVRAEIEHMRRQIHRQRREIRDLQRAGSLTCSLKSLCKHHDAVDDDIAF
jgi:hypothetical protein